MVKNLKISKILKTGKELCGHKWKQGRRQWDEIPAQDCGPGAGKINAWHYSGNVLICENCGREELLGGTILIPEGGDFFDGKYELEASGARGMCIVDGLDMPV
jgi:hypothetical protein